MFHVSSSRWVIVPSISSLAVFVCYKLTPSPFRRRAINTKSIEAAYDSLTALSKSTKFLFYHIKQETALATQKMKKMATRFHLTLDWSAFLVYNILPKYALNSTASKRDHFANSFNTSSAHQKPTSAPLLNMLSPSTSPKTSSFSDVFVLLGRVMDNFQPNDSPQLISAEYWGATLVYWVPNRRQLLTSCYTLLLISPRGLRTLVTPSYMWACHRF